MSVPFMLDESNELATWIFALHRSLSEDGHNADEIMARAGFDFKLIGSTTQHIPRYTAKLIWSEIESATEDDAYSLRIIPFVSDSYLNALVTIVQACGSVQQAISLFLKYYQLVDRTSKISISIGDNVLLEASHSCPSSPAPTQDIDILFALVTKYVQILLLNDIHPVRILFSRPMPRNIKAYQQYFPCPILFGQDKNTLEFPLDLLKQDIPGANPALSKHLEEYLSNMLPDTTERSLTHDRSLENDVKKELTQLLPSGTPKLKDIALRLNISERTLQRKLKKNDICYTKLLNHTRLELAKQYLQEPRQTIAKTAYQLGFSESGNFIRFFKQQTGQTPNSFVKEVTV